MKKHLKITLFILAMLTYSQISLAGGMGPTGPPGMGPKPGCWPPGNPNCVPIDGGITFLIAAGLAYGSKKTMQLRKK